MANAVSGCSTDISCLEERPHLLDDSKAQKSYVLTFVEGG